MSLRLDDVMSHSPGHVTSGEPEIEASICALWRRWGRNRDTGVVVVILQPQYRVFVARCSHSSFVAQTVLVALTPRTPMLKLFACCVLWCSCMPCPAPRYRVPAVAVRWLHMVKLGWIQARAVAAVLSVWTCTERRRREVSNTLLAHERCLSAPAGCRAVDFRR